MSLDWNQHAQTQEGFTGKPLGGPDESQGWRVYGVPQVVPQTGRLKQQKLTDLQFQKLEVREQGISRVGFSESCGGGSVQASL